MQLGEWLSAIMWSEELQIPWVLAILIPACASSSPLFLMMYSAYKLNKQGDNIDHKLFEVTKKFYSLWLHLLIASTKRFGLPW